MEVEIDIVSVQPLILEGMKYIEYNGIIVEVNGKEFCLEGENFQYDYISDKDTYLCLTIQIEVDKVSEINFNRVGKVLSVKDFEDMVSELPNREKDIKFKRFAHKVFLSDVLNKDRKCIETTIESYAIM